MFEFGKKIKILSLTFLVLVVLIPSFAQTINKSFTAEVKLYGLITESESANSFYVNNSEVFFVDKSFHHHKILDSKFISNLYLTVIYNHTKNHLKVYLNGVYYRTINHFDINSEEFISYIQNKSSAGELKLLNTKKEILSDSTILNNYLHNKKRFDLLQGGLLSGGVKYVIVTDMLLLHVRADDIDTMGNSADDTDTNTIWVDSTSGANDGTLSNFSLPHIISTDSGWSGTNVNTDPSKLQFDGSDDVVQFANESNFDFAGSNPFSLELFFKTSSMDGTGHSLINKLDVSASPLLTGYEAFINSSGQIFFRILGNNAAGDQILTFTTASGFNDGSWHHLVLTYNGSSLVSGLKTYIDGSLRDVTTSGTLTGMIVNNEPLRLGHRSDVSVNSLDGDIGLVRIYGKELSLSEVTQNFDTDGGIFGFNPTIESLTPADDSVTFDGDDNLVIVFNREVMVQSGNITIFTSIDDNVVEVVDVTSGQVTGSTTDTITINLMTSLLDETDYYIQIDSTAFDDLFGNSYAGIANETTWNFTTTDTTPPNIPVITSPFDGTLTGTKPTFMGTAEASSVIELFDGVTSAGTAITDGSGNWTLVPSINLTGGSRSITVTATDAFMNTSLPSVVLMINVIDAPMVDASDDLELSVGRAPRHVSRDNLIAPQFANTIIFIGSQLGYAINSVSDSLGMILSSGIEFYIAVVDNQDCVELISASVTETGDKYLVDSGLNVSSSVLSEGIGQVGIVVDGVVRGKNEAYVVESTNPPPRGSSPGIPLINNVALIRSIKTMSDKVRVVVEGNDFSTIASEIMGVAPIAEAVLSVDLLPYDIFKTKKIKTTEDGKVVTFDFIVKDGIQLDDLLLGISNIDGKSYKRISAPTNCLRKKCASYN